jgi:ribosome-binding protein aMBF1 (putative translation factor)
MKNIIKKNKRSVDAIAEVRKLKRFQELSKDVDLRLRLAVEIYKEREKLGLSQQDLAKKINSTQKVISNLENGDVNVGIDLISRVARALGFAIENWSKIHNFAIPEYKILIFVDANNSGNESSVQCGQVKDINTSISNSI